MRRGPPTGGDLRKMHAFRLHKMAEMAVPDKVLAARARQEKVFRAANRVRKARLARGEMVEGDERRVYQPKSRAKITLPTLTFRGD